MSGFLASLSFRDLHRLRRVVKAVHLFYSSDFCTDREADRIIEALGPVVAERLLKRAVDAGRGG